MCHAVVTSNMKGDNMNGVVMDDVMNRGIPQQLEDLEFADNIDMLSNTFNKLYITKRPGTTVKNH
jgi:hypothetical protein